MPPDYPQKENNENENQVPNHLESLEEKLYMDNANLDLRRSSLRNKVTPAVRTEWASSSPRQEVAEPIVTRNNFAFLKQFLIGSIILFVASLGIAAYVFLGDRNVVSTKNIAININVPPSVAGGETLPVEINITNQNNVSLISADVLVEYSDGGRQPENLSQELKRYRETINAVSVGATVNKKYGIVFFGEEGESKDIKVTLEYRVSGSNAIFSKTEIRSIKLSSAPVSVSVLSPSEASAGEEMNFTVTVSANSIETIKNLRLVADYPFGFQFTGSDTKTTYGNVVWDLGDLKSGATRVIKLRGKFSGNEGEERVVRFSVGTADLKDQRRVGVVFLSKTQTINIAKPPVSLELALGGSSDPEYITDAGRGVRADISYKNNLDTKITNVVIQAKLIGTILDKPSVSVTEGFYRSIDNIVVWDQTTNKNLAILEPGDGGNLSFSFQTLQSALNMKSSSMSIEVTVIGNRLSADSQIEQVKLGTSKIVKVASQLQVSARALYSSGPFLNSGAVPPKAEKETTYTIVLSAVNASNDLSDVIVRTSIPIHIKWLGKISPENEDLKYNPVGGEIVWNIGNLKSAGGAREVAFQVSFLPSLSQVKGYPALLNSVKASGFDKFSNVNLSAAQQSLIDISLPSDPVYQGRGGPVGQ